jgi:hypothetical protein
MKICKEKHLCSYFDKEFRCAVYLCSNCEEYFGDTLQFLKHLLAQKDKYIEELEGQINVVKKVLELSKEIKKFNQSM